MISIRITYAQSRYVDSLQHIVARQQHDTTEVDALLLLTNEYLREDLGKAKTSSYQIVQISKSRHWPGRLGGGYLYLIAIHQNEGNPDSARHYISLLGSLSKDNPQDKLMVKNYNQSINRIVL